MPWSRGRRYCPFDGDGHGYLVVSVASNVWAITLWRSSMFEAWTLLGVLGILEQKNCFRTISSIKSVWKWFLKNKKNIILMYFGMKSNRKHTSKQAHRREFWPLIRVTLTVNCMEKSRTLYLKLVLKETWVRFCDLYGILSND